MKNAKITRAFLKSAAENAIKKRRNSICNAFVLRSVLYTPLIRTRPKLNQLNQFPTKF